MRWQLESGVELRLSWKAGSLSSSGLSLWFLVCSPFLDLSPMANNSLLHVSSCRARGVLA